MSCPICKRPVPASSAVSPFCSPRCRSVDLARWLGGDYRLPGEFVDPDQFADLAPAPEAPSPRGRR